MKTVDLKEIVRSNCKDSLPAWFYELLEICMKEAIRQDRQIQNEKVREVLEETIEVLRLVVTHESEDLQEKIQTLLTELE